MYFDVTWYMRDKLIYSFTSTETRRFVRTDSSGRPPRLSHSSWTMIECVCDHHALRRGYMWNICLDLGRTAPSLLPCIYSLLFMPLPVHLFVSACMDTSVYKMCGCVCVCARAHLIKNKSMLGTYNLIIWLIFLLECMELPSERIYKQRRNHWKFEGKYLLSCFIFFL